jgi:hypothetical protein
MLEVHLMEDRNSGGDRTHTRRGVVHVLGAGNLAFGWLVLVVGTWLEEPLRSKGPRWHLSLTTVAAIIGTIICVLIGRFEIAYMDEHGPPPPYIPARLPSAISLFMETNAVNGMVIADCDSMDITGPYFGKLQYKYFDRVAYDFRTNAMLITYYMPDHPILAHDDNMLKLVGFIASQTERQVAIGKDYFKSAFAGAANTMSSVDFKFTGRVYVYLDELMELGTRTKLEKIFAIRVSM